MRTYNHVGIIVKEKAPGAFFDDYLKVWMTDFNLSPNKFEFLTFEEGSPMPEIIQNQAHIAYTVPSIEEELKDKEAIFGPLDVNEHLKIVFIEEEGIAVELVEIH